MYMRDLSLRSLARTIKKTGMVVQPDGDGCRMLRDSAVNRKCRVSGGPDGQLGRCSRGPPQAVDQPQCDACRPHSDAGERADARGDAGPSTGRESTDNRRPERRAVRLPSIPIRRRIGRPTLEFDAACREPLGRVRRPRPQG